MNRLRVTKLADAVIVRAVGGEVNGIKVIVTGPNVVLMNEPTKLAPTVGNVVIAQRSRPHGGEPKYGTVTVGWEQGDDRNTKVITW